jgi:hypothetical protein
MRPIAARMAALQGGHARQVQLGLIDGNHPPSIALSKPQPHRRIGAVPDRHSQRTARRWTSCSAPAWPR